MKMKVKRKLTMYIFIMIFILNVCLLFNIQYAASVTIKPYKDMGLSCFTEEEKLLSAFFEYYSELDDLGRCGVAFANVCKETMPTEPRSSIGMIKPTGWQTPQNKYDFIDGKYLYNRCHLIAYELTAENANERNLVTGTRYMNIYGMKPFEDKVAGHVKSTNHHVLYRSTPIFEGNDLLCKGIQIEAYCLDEQGGSIDFCVLCHNIQPNIVIDYATGKNWPW